MANSNKLLGIVIPIHRQNDFSPRLVDFLKEAEELGVQVAITVNSESSVTRENLLAAIRALNLQNLKIATDEYSNAGKARNISLQMLDTEWVCFLDADDCMNLANCLTLISNSTDKGPDLIVGSIRVQKYDAPGKYKDFFVEPNLDPVVSLGLFPAFTRIIYRNSFISGLLFPMFEIAEDQAFLIQVLLRNPKIEFCDLNVYTYFVGGKLQSTNLSSKYPDLASALIFFAELYDRESPKNRNILLMFLLRIYLALMKRYRYLTLSLILRSSYIALKALLRHPLNCLKYMHALRNFGGISLE